MASRKSRKNKDKDNQLENTTDDCVKKYLNINQNNLLEDDIEKIKNFYNSRKELANKLKEETNLEELYDLAETNLRKNSNLEIESFQTKNKNNTIEGDNLNFKKINEDLTTKFNNKDNFSKLLIEKIKTINEEKNKIIYEETEIRNKLVKETEEFVKSLQEKHELELPEKQKLIEENQRLRKEIENTVKETIEMKESFENKLKEKEKKALDFEINYKNDLRTKMETTTLNAQKYLLENSEYKSQIITYQKKNEEMLNAIEMFTKEYAKLEIEIEKKKKDILTYSQENVDLKEKIKSQAKLSKEELTEMAKDYEKTHNQLKSMISLNKKLQEQYDKLSSETKVENNNSNEN